MLTLLLIFIPLGAALLTYVSKSFAKQIAFVISLLELALGIYVCATFVPDATPQFTASLAWLPSLGIQFSVGIDGISLLLVLLTVLLVPVIILSSFGKTIPNESVFYALVLAMQSALVGVFTAKDAFLFYIFFEVALIPVYFLSAIWGGENRIRVTFKFFIYTIFGSLFMLLALVVLYLKTFSPHTANISSFYTLLLDAHTQGYIFWALFIAFAIKMPLFPFHTWQPDTYTESPTTATMLLSGIMLKMGTYGLLRFLLPIAPVGLNSFGNIAIILSVIGIVYGAVIAIQQRDMKRLIAYSSFSHVGLMAAGIFSKTESGIQGALIQMLAHGVTVVGLFFVIDIIQQRTNSRDLNRLGGITQQAPRLTVFFMLMLLSSVALPLTSGFVGEFLLLKGVFEYNTYLGAIAGLSIIFGAVYMLRMFQKAMFGTTTTVTEAFNDLNLQECLVLMPLAVMVFWIGLYPNFFLKFSAPATQALLKIINTALIIH